MFLTENFILQQINQFQKLDQVEQAVVSWNRNVLEWCSGTFLAAGMHTGTISH